MKHPIYGNQHPFAFHFKRFLIRVGILNAIILADLAIIGYLAAKIVDK